jgi:ABC-2 type transport system permease protein
MGKLAGIAAVGLTMVGAWVLSFLGLLAWKAGGAQSEITGQLYTIVRSSNLLPAFVIYFLFGYVMYAGLILALGSVCNTLKEAQNYMGVMTMIMVVPLLTMMFIPKDPNGTLATVLSWIPLYTPFIMMNRAAADPPLFDLIGTMALLIATTALALWLAVRIFRIGILRTGQPPKLVELLRWLKT